VRSPPPADQADRERALASRKNVAVTAGAGTGKTTLLVSKVVRKVVEEGLELKHLLALTFTEKAAGEMRQRIREQLEKAGRSEGLDRAEIGTIHSFCAHVLRQFPVEAGVAPDFEVDEGAAFRRLFDRAWPRWLDGELGPGSRRGKRWSAVLRKVKIGTLRELALGLASFGIPDDRADAPEVLERLAAEASEGATPELAAALRGKGPPPSKPRGSALRLAEDMAAMDAKLTGEAVRLVSDFAAKFRREYLAEGWVSFDGMLALVYDLLRSEEFPNVLELLRDRYRFILVDEFQDTDPLQGEIIRRLAEGPDDRLVPGKLFLVGDPKQSIYSFRGADIIAYRRLTKRIVDEGGDSVVLRTNFRSHGGILDLVNAVFKDAMVERGDLQPKYEPIEPAAGRAPRLAGPTVEAVLIEGAGARSSREAEGEAVAEWIAAGRVPCRDVAILLRALTDVNLYIEPLRARGIPYVVEGEKYFYGTTEVIDFVNVLRAVSNPHDRVAVAAVLRSPLGGFSDQELYDKRREFDYRAFHRRASDSPAARLLKRWHDQAGRLSVPALIDLIFDEGWTLETAQAGSHGEQAVANLLKLRRKAAEMEAQGGVTLREFLDAARRAVREMEEEGESPLADESLDAVRILSIHKAKGLEFPVVILPDLHRRPAASDDRVVRFDWPTRTLGVRLDGACDAGGAALAYLDRERRREEDRRVLYVAMTRAEEALVLLGSAEAPSGSYLSLLLPEIRKRARVERRAWRPASPPSPPAPAGPEEPDWAAFDALWKRREARAAALPKFTSPTRLESNDKVNRLLYHVDGEPARPSRAVEVGVACHRVMETLDFKAPAVPEGTDPEAAEILRGFFGSAAFRELADSEILARELPFVMPRGGQVVEGVIDVVYRRGAKLYAADYKTDKIVEPGDYALIREIYSGAVRRVFKVEPGFKLFYLRHGREVEL
jgi:ATP-dependent helicase/nuclease subunit A